MMDDMPALSFAHLDDGDEEITNFDDELSAWLDDASLESVEDAVLEVAPTPRRFRPSLAWLGLAFGVAFGGGAVVVAACTFTLGVVLAEAVSQL